MPVAPSSWTARPDALADKTVLVTGAAEGIGRAASLAYAAHGAEVLLLSRNEARLES
ncbi:MAG: SDR family NAD(P)-dependent oxidoreductase, partial [Gammaproteobacteria bacterium]